MKTYNDLKMLGVGLPILANMNQTKILSLMKAAVLFFILLQFMDKITTLAAKLVGGSELKSNTMSAADMAGKANEVVRGIQRRGMGMIKKNILPRAGRAAGVAFSGIAALGSRGKKASDTAERSEGGHTVGNSGSEGSGGNNADNSASRSGGESDNVVNPLHGDDSKKS
jgi:hypothetical protein